MKRFSCGLLAALTLAAALAVSALAADSSRTFAFDLSVDGSTQKKAAAGDIITVTFTLRRTDADEAYTMYAMQNEILYDSTFFELVPGSAVTAEQIQTNDIALRDDDRAFYMNAVSLTGGQTWQADTVVGTFQLKVIGTAGSSVIRSSSYQVATRDGSDHFTATAQDVTVTVSDGCRVRFDSNGGTEVPDQVVALGGKVRRPEDPTKEGLYLEGWYSDMDLQQRWDFQKDTVGGNMTLYAKWTEKAPGAQLQLWWLVVLILLLVVALLILWGRKNARHRGQGAEERRRRGGSGAFQGDVKKEERDE